MKFLYFFGNRLLIAIIIVLTIMYYNKQSNVEKQKEQIISTTPFNYNIQHSPREVWCLAQNMYHEARGETELGNTLVAIVTLNRAKTQGKDICSIVYEPYQFSWTLDKQEVSETKLQYHLYLARLVLTDRIQVPHEYLHATHYYASYIKQPYWSKKMEEIGQVGNHIFFKDPKMIAENRASYMK